MSKTTTNHPKLISFFTVIVLCTFFIQCSKEAPIDIPEPEVIHAFSAGDYVGVWNTKTATQTFENVAISARISVLSNGNYEGTFYISSVFRSCCGSGDSDGTIKFKIEDNKISGFNWDDIIPDCEAIFSGTGKLLNDSSFIINISGTDCDGTHAGRVRLDRQ